MPRGIICVYKHVCLHVKVEFDIQANHMYYKTQTDLRVSPSLSTLVYLSCAGRPSPISRILRLKFRRHLCCSTLRSSICIKLRTYSEGFTMQRGNHCMQQMGYSSLLIDMTIQNDYMVQSININQTIFRCSPLLYGHYIVPDLMVFLSNVIVTMANLLTTECMVSSKFKLI